MTEHETLAAALVAALEGLRVVETARKVDFTTKEGKRINYDYADIGDVVKLTRPALAEHGIVALTPVHAHGDGLACTVTLLHASGDRLDLGPFPFPHGRDAQATGSMVTYHRRYALVAALGMAAGDDDDGAAAQPRQREQARPSGITSADAGDKLREHLDGKVPGDVTEHAKAVWKEAHPKAADGRIPAAEVERLLKVADEYVADLEAMATDAEQPELTDA